MTFAQAKKFYVALIGFLTQIVNVAIFNGATEHYIALALALLTAGLVFWVPNAPQAAAKP